MMLYGETHSSAITSLDGRFQQPSDDQYLTTFFCRALYDYRSQDASSLSFYKGDIIEVLTQLESGWWDGLLNDERGWFPSNYVQRISDQEAEAELGSSEFYTPGSESQLSQTNDDNRARFDRDWARQDAEIEAPVRNHSSYQNGISVASQTSSDFWVPQVTQDGQIYYVNTQTGEHSRDLPFETDNEVSDRNLGLLSTVPGAVATGSNSSPSDSTSKRVSTHQITSPGYAGFGISRRNGTPEPWIRRLADDGLSFYYVNKLDGQVRWTRPEASDEVDNPEESSKPSNRRPTVTSTSSSEYKSSNYETTMDSSRLRSNSATSQPPTASSSTNRLSVYSDDSDVLDPNAYRTDHTKKQRERRSFQGQREASEDMFSFTPAERAAITLQKSLQPDEPESVDVWCDRAREAISRVLAAADTSSLHQSTTTDKDLESYVKDTVTSVRNLLYVSCAITGPLLNNLGERNANDSTATAAAHQLQALLKTSQRKVTATLSKLVLSTRAAKCKRETLSTEMLVRVQQDANDLKRAVESFIMEVQKQYGRTAIQQLHARMGRKRLEGVFGLDNIGPAMPGAGVGGLWKGFGFTVFRESYSPPNAPLSSEVISEIQKLAKGISGLLANIRRFQEAFDMLKVRTYTEDLLSQLSLFLALISDIHVAQYVDVDGMLREQEDVQPDETYSIAVDQARALIRSLELFSQRLFDNCADILFFLQSSNIALGLQSGSLQPVLISIASHTESIPGFLDGLSSVGQKQADAGQNEYVGSIEWRMSRISGIMDSSRPLSSLFGALQEAENEGEDVVDMEMAIRLPNPRPVANITPISSAEASRDFYSNTTEARADEEIESISQSVTLENGAVVESSSSTAVSHEPLIDDERVAPGRGAEKDKRPAKLRQLLGPDVPEPYIDGLKAEAKPWYLRSDYRREDILINPDGGVRAGTLTALVERLTTHDIRDPIFIKTFLLTFKSFTTLNELFDLLVQRYFIKPPENLSPDQLDEWTKYKQHLVRLRVLNTLKNMLTDEDILEKEDLYILDRMRAFINSPEVSQLSAAKNLLNVIDRAQLGEDAVVKMTAVTPSFPPPPITPRIQATKKLKLLDIDPLEMARQLTILESRLYNKIRASECLQRSREQKGENQDSIAGVIQTTNRIASWVADTILRKEDSRKRAAIVKQFISIADRCRTLNNFSSMVAIVSGLNSPPIRRLKRTWEQVNGRFMTQMSSCEMTVDTGKNFANYRTTLAKVVPPCIPFIGVYLTVLIFIQEGGKDVLPGNLINFGKRQKAAEVIREIKHWQSKPYNLQPLPPVLAFIETALNSFDDSKDWGDYFWNLSLEREPREREDEKMARLLQESGFL